jgi:hypothetical protein
MSRMINPRQLLLATLAVVWWAALVEGRAAEGRPNILMFGSVTPPRQLVRFNRRKCGFRAIAATPLAEASWLTKTGSYS